MRVQVLKVFSIEGEGGRVCPPCASWSDGAGALAHPQGKAHGGCLAGGLMLAPNCHGSGLEVGAGGISVAHQHVAGVLEELLLGHGGVGSLG